MSNIREHSGKKYLRTIRSAVDDGVVEIDVYCVIDAFAVACPGRQHALKKILCAGNRGKADTLKDLQEAVDALQRAIELEQKRS